MSKYGVTAKDFMKSRGDLRLIGRTDQAMDVHGKTTTMQFEGKTWHTVSTDIDWAAMTQSQWVLLGSSQNQENLFFDENSEFMSKFKAIAEGRCKNKSITEVLKTVNNMINRITDIEGMSRDEVEASLDKKLEEYISAKRKNSKFIDIHLEELAANKLLVCRHKGLLAASVIGHLINKGILPQGTSREYRSVIIDNQQKLIGAHLWATYRDKTNETLWICDPRSDIVLNVNSDYSTVSEIYGKLATDDMIKRLSIIEAKTIFTEDLALLDRAFIKSNTLQEKIIVLEAQTLSGKQKLIEQLQREGIRLEFSENFPKMIVIKQCDNPRKFVTYEKILLENPCIDTQSDTKMFVFSDKVRYKLEKEHAQQLRIQRLRQAGGTSTSRAVPMLTIYKSTNGPLLTRGAESPMTLENQGYSKRIVMTP